LWWQLIDRAVEIKNVTMFQCKTLQWYVRAYLFQIHTDYLKFAYKTIFQVQYEVVRHIVRTPRNHIDRDYSPMTPTDSVANGEVYNDILVADINVYFSGFKLSADYIAVYEIHAHQLLEPMWKVTIDDFNLIAPIT
jgi:hypothetical protein